MQRIAAAGAPGAPLSLPPRVDAGASSITFRPLGAVSPAVMGTEFSRAYELTGDVLTITSQPGEAHADGMTRWTWERVPTVDNLSAGYPGVIGFWEHVVDERLNATTGAALSESKRAPSVIVYTPSGYVGVHFPPLNRARFAPTFNSDGRERTLVTLRRLSGEAEMLPQRRRQVAYPGAVVTTGRS